MSTAGSMMNPFILLRYLSEFHACAEQCWMFIFWDPVIVWFYSLPVELIWELWGTRGAWWLCTRTEIWRRGSSVEAKLRTRPCSGNSQPMKLMLSPSRWRLLGTEVVMKWWTRNAWHLQPNWSTTLLRILIFRPCVIPEIHRNHYSQGFIHKTVQ